VDTHFLETPLQFIISTIYDLHNEITHQIVSNNSINPIVTIFNAKLEELQICTKHLILKIILPFTFFCMVLIGEKVIKCWCLCWTLNLKYVFKVTSYVNHKNEVNLVVDHDS
jgi:hypothetical protein